MESKIGRALYEVIKRGEKCTITFLRKIVSLLCKEKNMRKNVFNFTLDIKRASRIVIPRIVNGDTSNRFVITLKDGGNNIELFSTLDKVYAIFRRADGQVYVQDEDHGVSFANGGSVVTVDVYASSFRTGENTIELAIYSKEQSSDTEYEGLITTNQAFFTARNENLSDHAGTSLSQLPMLEQLIHDAGVAVDNCNTATTAANAAAGSANAAATSANNAATAANNAAASANAAAAAVQPLYLNYSDGFSWNDLKEAWDDNRQVYLIETLNGYPNYKAMYRLSHLDYDGSTYYAGFIGSAFQTWRTKVMATCWGFTSNDPDEGMT